MAIKRWRGAAAAVAQVSTITFSAYTSGETYTVTVNGKDVSYTAAASTLADVINGLVAAIGASAELEFSDFIAANSSGLVLTGATAGQPFVVAASATSGITATNTATVAATGPNFFDNADNWDAATLPVAGDDLVFEDSSVSVLYAVEDTTVYGDITVAGSFTGSIGLPKVTQSGYQEYRPQFLKLGDGSGTHAVTIGQGDGNQSSRIKLDANDATFNVAVFATGQSATTERPLRLKNTDSSSTMEVYSGSVSIGADTSGALANLRITPGDGFSAPAVVADSTVACGAVVCAGGTLEIRGSATSLEATSGGSVTITSAATCPTVSAASGAVVTWQSTAGITTKAFVYASGTLDFSGNAATKAVAAVDVHAGANLLDPLGIVTWTSGIALIGCKVGDLNLDVGRNKTLTPS